MKQKFRLALISAGLMSAFGLFSPAANAAKITVALSGQGQSLKCSTGYVAKTLACPTIAGPVPASCPTDWVGVPSMNIPTGPSTTRNVPAFCVMKYIPGNVGAVATSSASATPWVSINWADAQTKCAASTAGGRLIRESEWMALAHNLTGVDANWTGGAVDNGNIKDGLQNSEAGSAQPSTGTAATGGGRPRTLSTGDVVWDIGGNVYQWTYNDLTGASSGQYGTSMPVEQVAVPYASQTRGMGYYPAAGTNWSGYAPVRGGDWDHGTNAGPFRLDYHGPTGTSAGIGFRCTK